MSELEQWPDAEWPDEQRIDLIGQNGPTAEHYSEIEQGAANGKQ